MINYKDFAKEKSIKVFVIIGIGGEANLPKELSIIPLTEIKSIFLDKAFFGEIQKG